MAHRPASLEAAAAQHGGPATPRSTLKDTANVMRRLCDAVVAHARPDYGPNGGAAFVRDIVESRYAPLAADGAAHNSSSTSVAGSATEPTRGGTGAHGTGSADGASGSHLDLNHAPYILYGVKYIDPVSLALKKHGVVTRTLN